MAQSTAAAQDRIVRGLGFVENLARRVAASMPHSIDIGDLVQDGMLGLIDAAHRFDEERGIRFETFAERRVRGAMIDALRRDAWPRGIRRVRRQLEAAREDLRRELGGEPSLADLAARIGTDETRLGRTIVRINTSESTSPMAKADQLDGASLPPALVPAEVPGPDTSYTDVETRERIRRAVSTLPPRERKVIGMYYFREATMKQIGAEIGVNESRVSQLHARAIERLKKAFENEQAAVDRRRAMAEFAKRRSLSEVVRAPVDVATGESPAGDRHVVLQYPSTTRAGRPARGARLRPLAAAAR
jgi:RNA polymerase sigma factor for flagellar operon FliA